MEELTCNKHSRVLIGKTKCVDCEAEKGINVFIDGACEPYNPNGTASYGVYIQIGDIEHKMYGIVGSGTGMSNNVAEYTGLYKALEWLKSRGYQNTLVKVYGDSMMAMRQMAGDWQINKGFYIEMAKKCLLIAENFKDISFTWIPREENSIADDLSKLALEEKGIRLRIQPKN